MTKNRLLAGTGESVRAGLIRRAVIRRLDRGYFLPRHLLLPDP
jgi:hypothetical protein